MCDAGVGTEAHLSFFVGAAGTNPHPAVETRPVPAPEACERCQSRGRRGSSGLAVPFPLLSQASPRLAAGGGTPLVTQGGTSPPSASASLGMEKWGKNPN